MNPMSYIKNVLITEARNYNPVIQRLSEETNMRLIHACAGISSELAELIELSEKFDPDTKEPLDRVNLMEECGDILWYVGVASDALNAVEEITEIEVHNELISYDDDLIGEVDRIITLIAKHAGILVDRAVKKHIFYGKEYNASPMIDQLKAIHSLVNLILTAAGYTIEQAREINIAKLKARYGDKFSEAAALDRNLVNERKILEGN